MYTADGDTLFLDEIGDISRDMQRLLIKAVEEHTYVRLGDTDQRKSDFRLLTATNHSWHELKETLDSDFLDRFSMLQLWLPPLREIPEDLDWLWQNVWNNTVGGISQTFIPPPNPEWQADLLGILRGHPLPGNMRALMRVACNALVYCDKNGNIVISAKELVEQALGNEAEETELTRRIAEAFA